MKVKELIEELKKFNPESEVGKPDYYGSLEEIDLVYESDLITVGSKFKDVMLI